jgi:LSD1 subclass zinc finger protein
MRAFLGRVQYALARWMQGRYGVDGLSKWLLGIGVVLVLVYSFFGGWWWYVLALVCLLASVLRSLSRNIERRSRENEACRRAFASPRRAISHTRDRWRNRKTTRYLKCKGCGTMLSVPRGKGKLRVTCPKCHAQAVIDSK